MTTTCNCDECTCSDRADELRVELRGAIRRYLAAVAELEAPAASLAAIDGELRAALYQSGSAPAAGPTVRELAAEALLGAAGPLRPFVTFVTAESAKRSAEHLLSL